MVLVNALFHPVMAGILLAAILAAVMSTADSQLLVSSSALTEDFYKALFRKEATEKELVMVGRLAVVGIAAIALLLARDPDSSVLGLVSYAWAGFGAAFGPALILALFWKRMTRNGALAGILVGGITVVVWKQLSGGIFDIYEIVPGFILAWIMYILRPEFPAKLAKANWPLYNFLLNKWYFDEIYDVIFVRPARAIGRFLWKRGDGKVIDGALNGVAMGIVPFFTRLAGRAQSGYIFTYAFAMVIGIVVLITWMTLSGGAH